MDISALEFFMGMPLRIIEAIAGSALPMTRPNHKFK
jgi:hypothetical protein